MTSFAFDLAVPPFGADRVDTVFALAEEIFGKVKRAGFDWRLGRLPDPSIALASDDLGLAGFKLGYGVAPGRYYSWLGGVAVRARRQGVARRLMQLQHTWVRERGYTSIETGATSDNVAMLKLNREAGFEAIGEYDRDGSPRVLLFKRFPEG